jgi:ABC-type multidrug transport system fused ATPase/permease subunit
MVIKHISVWSAAKLLGLLNTLAFAIFGLIANLIGILISISEFGSFGMDRIIIGSVISYVIGIVVVLIVSTIAGALYAFFYNIVAKFTGGIEMKVDIYRDEGRHLSR